VRTARLIAGAFIVGRDEFKGARHERLGQASETARESAAGFDKWLRKTVETQPYTAAAVALGIGWLLGRLHEPL
jgi:hypothetical protein